MRRTGHDFQDIHVFREFPDGVREQHDRESYPLRAVRVKKGAALEGNLLIRSADDGDERPDLFPAREVVTRNIYFVFWQSDLPEGAFFIS